MKPKNTRYSKVGAGDVVTEVKRTHNLVSARKQHETPAGDDWQGFPYFNDENAPEDA